ncbi:hypothetical protein HYW84_03380 [Candidatus Peregrinibacteria bacterium]|nr:hypothetical protein [Candidatus Peregrinibacteria bacterium]
MLTSGILGHSAQLADIAADISSGNVVHAYLFSGAPHLGKFTIAKLFGRYLLCHGRSEDERAAIADQIDRLLHPDFLVIDRLWIENVCEDLVVIAKSSNIPQQHRMKAKPPARTDKIRIDDIRAVQERMHEVGTGRYRCCIIRSVERMQIEAISALLKILEEPPDGVVFLMTTQSLQSLPPTLVSRARTLHFSRLTDVELEPFLGGTSEDERKFLLRVAQGTPGILRRLRDDTELFRIERQMYSNALAFWHSRSNIERMRLLKPLHERGAASDKFLLHLLLALREENENVSPSIILRIMSLCRNLTTNVNRQLLAQQFVLGILEHA